MEKMSTVSSTEGQKFHERKEIQQAKFKIKTDIGLIFILKYKKSPCLRACRNNLDR
jgi:hypothetical protein